MLDCFDGLATLLTIDSVPGWKLGTAAWPLTQSVWTDGWTDLCGSVFSSGVCCLKGGNDEAEAPAQASVSTLKAWEEAGECRQRTAEWAVVIHPSYTQPPSWKQPRRGRHCKLQPPIFTLTQQLRTEVQELDYKSGDRWGHWHIWKDLLHRQWTCPCLLTLWVHDQSSGFSVAQRHDNLSWLVASFNPQIILFHLQEIAFISLDFEWTTKKSQNLSVANSSGSGDVVICYSCFLFFFFVRLHLAFLCIALLVG